MSPLHTPHTRNQVLLFVIHLKTTLNNLLAIRVVVVVKAGERKEFCLGVARGMEIESESARDT